MTKISRVREMQARNKTICEYCGAEKEGIGFYIGASLKPDWTMIEGTGKMCCPACWEMARAEGVEAIDRHCASLRG